MDRKTFRMGTRGSALAVAQSGWVARELERAAGVSVEVVIIKTRGDAITDRPLDLIGGKGLFTKEIEVALLHGDVDFAVHSMKDLPDGMPEGLVLGAVPVREDPRDAVVGGKIGALAPGSVVGTGSPRRRIQLQGLRGDLEVRGVRGNVDTRINKQRSGEYAAVLLAAAGLARLGRSGDIDEILPVDAMIPAAGQGALAVQCRSGDSRIRTALGAIHHFPTAICVDAERAFLATLGGGCSVPAACHAQLVGDGGMRVLAFFAEGEIGRRVVIDGEAEDAIALGQRAAAEVRADGV